MDEFKKCFDPIFVTLRSLQKQTKIQTDNVLAMVKLMIKKGYFTREEFDQQLKLQEEESNEIFQMIDVKLKAGTSEIN